MQNLILLFLFYLLSGTAAWAGSTEPDPELRELLREAIGSSDSFSDRFEAEVWLKLNSDRAARFLPDPGERLEILRNVHYEARRASLSPELVLSVIEVESAFDRFALSGAGAQGLMQVMPFWLKEIGHPKDNLMDIRTNLRMGCTILRYYLDLEDGEYIPALARYNGSVGRPDYPRKVIGRWTRVWTP
jgi:soluble lytic murein transglycosylase-like protein